MKLLNRDSIIAKEIKCMLQREGYESGSRLPSERELAERFGQAVREDINPRDSWRAAKDFRMHIAAESAKRAFTESVRLAGGDL